VTAALSPELGAALRRLRLGRIADTLPARLALAQAQGMPFDELLLLVLHDEIARRDASATELRAKSAGLDPTMTLERFDPTAKITYDKRLFAELCSLRFVAARKHLTLLGPVGVGKTFLSTALGHLACQHGYHVHFARADRMLHTLRKSRFDNSHEVEMRKLVTVDVLVLDDFALEPMSADESRDVYQLLVERTGRASMIVTSNRDTGEWLAMFDEPLRAQSALDRYVNAAFDLVVEGESYRPRLKPSLETVSTSLGPTDAKRPARGRRR
jgi:DNA replication protein DnaC